MSEEIIEKVTKRGSEIKPRTTNEAIQVARFWARFVVAVSTLAIFAYIVHIMLMSNAELPQSSKDLLNILIGAFIPILSGIAKFYFDSGGDIEDHSDKNPSPKDTDV
jgi:hypothetical protein